MFFGLRKTPPKFPNGRINVMEKGFREKEKRHCVCGNDIGY
jgi:hypothetical protein